VEPDESINSLLDYYDHNGLPKGSIDSGTALSHMAEVLEVSTSGTQDRPKGRAANHKIVRFAEDSLSDGLTSTPLLDVDLQIDDSDEDESTAVILSSSDDESDRQRCRRHHHLGLMAMVAITKAAVTLQVTMIQHLKRRLARQSQSSISRHRKVQSQARRSQPDVGTATRRPEKQTKARMLEGEMRRL